MYSRLVNNRLLSGTRKEMVKKKQGKKKGKKDSQLVIRISGEERDRFVSLCEEMDTSAAREIRKFIGRFLKENSMPEPSWIHFPFNQGSPEKHLPDRWTSDLPKAVDNKRVICTLLTIRRKRNGKIVKKSRINQKRNESQKSQGRQAARQDLNDNVDIPWYYLYRWSWN